MTMLAEKCAQRRGSLTSKLARASPTYLLSMSAGNRPLVESSEEDQNAMNHVLKTRIVTVSRKENGLGRSRASFTTGRPSRARSLSL
eukprot:561164-Pelagomonas_calceolata.AAC.1